METFNKLAGIRITHIPFKGTAQSLVALLGGDIELLVGPDSLDARADRRGPRARAGAIGHTRAARYCPQCPPSPSPVSPASKRLRGTESQRPPGTPAEIVRRLAADIAKAVASQDLNAKYVTEGVEPETNTPAEYAAFLRAEVTRWGQAVKNAGITAN